MINLFKGPLLLGFSGGADSLYLFYQLLEQGIPFAAAHVDHRWRKESADEAKFLEALCARHHVKFYLKVLDPATIQGNLEDECRKARLAFFYQIYQEGYAAVVLGHHADDQAETVIKRLFEGASLTALGCMREIAYYEGMPLWRPLLSTTKAEILRFHAERGIQPVNDATNQDTQFLRPRLRHELLPYLSQCFGKEITGALGAISDEAHEWKAYMDEKCPQLLFSAGPFGSYADFSGCTHPFEVKYLIRKLLKQFQLVLSRSELHSCLHFILQKSGNKWVNQKLYIDRGKLFHLSPSEEGWQMSIGRGAGKDATHWTDAWKGRLEVFLPPGEYTLGPPSPELDKWWTAHKVPAFMRRRVPVLWKEGAVFHEFLSGRKLRNETGDHHFILIKKNSSCKHSASVDKLKISGEKEKNLKEF